MPFRSSAGGGPHERYIDVEEGEEPLGLTGDAEGPTYHCSEELISLIGHVQVAIEFQLTIFIKSYNKVCGIGPYSNCLSCY